MNPGKDYAIMIQEQTKLALTLPLGMAWEFMPRPIQKNLDFRSDALAALARSNRWQLPSPLRQLFGQHERAVIVTNRWQIIQYVNESFEHMTGYGMTEAVGRKPNFLQGHATDPAARQRMRMAIEQEQPNKEAILNYRKDGSTYWCDITIFPVRNDQQQLVNFIAFEQETSV